MALSIPIDPILEAQIAQEAKRLGMSEARLLNLHQQVMLDSCDKIP